MDNKTPTCWMCGGWTFIHPLDTGDKWHTPSGETGPVYVWAATRAAHSPGDIDCPACQGTGHAEQPATQYPGEIEPLDSRLW